MIVNRISDVEIAACALSQTNVMHTLFIPHKPDQPKLRAARARKQAHDKSLVTLLESIDQKLNAKP